MLQYLDDVTFDATDRLIAAALQVNGRASWGEIARALELPERTVARRGQSLFERGLVRVSTYVDVMRVLHARAVLLRITTQNGALWSVARILARIPIASSVSVLEGSNDIACMFLPRNERQIRELLHREIPQLPGITSLNASTVLKFFRSGHDWIPPILAAEQMSALEDLGRVRVDPNDVISTDEDRLIELLLQEGRASASQLARELGVSVVTVRKRMESLSERGLMHPRTEVVPTVFGLNLEALVWFRAPMDRIDQIGKDLATAPEVKFAVATTGVSQMLVNVLVKDEQAFYDFLTGDTVTRHEGLEVYESLVVLTPVLRGSLVVDEGGDL
ncbi:MAG: Lrp/AsnC family transcriptional regulator [Leucobacter sp.]